MATAGISLSPPLFFYFILFFYRFPPVSLRALALSLGGQRSSEWKVF